MHFRVYEQGNQAYDILKRHLKDGETPPPKSRSRSKSSYSRKQKADPDRQAEADRRAGEREYQRRQKQERKTKSPESPKQTQTPKTDSKATVPLSFLGNIIAMFVFLIYIGGLMSTMFGCMLVSVSIIDFIDNYMEIGEDSVGFIFLFGLLFVASGVCGMLAYLKFALPALKRTVRIIQKHYKK